MSTSIIVGVMSDGTDAGFSSACFRRGVEMMLRMIVVLKSRRWKLSRKI